MEDDFGVCKAAVMKWGVELQKDMMQEECAELIQAIFHEKRGKCDASTVKGELADVEIMLNQMRIIYGDWEQERNAKLERLQRRLHSPKQESLIP